jgi:TPR repeat protein
LCLPSLTVGLPVGFTAQPGSPLGWKELRSAIEFTKSDIISNFTTCFPFLMDYFAEMAASYPDDTDRWAAIKSSARQGNLMARVAYGISFLPGGSNDVNTTKAMKYFKSAARGGCPEGQILYASLIEDDHPKKSIAYFKLAARQGDPMAQVIRGLNITDDRKAALKFEASANQGFACGEVLYGIRCMVGVGVPRNHDKAFQYFTRAAKSGNPQILFLAALGLWEQGKRETEFSTVTKWLKESADLGYAPAQTWYAWMVENGKGVEKNVASAIEYYRKAVDIGYGPARPGLLRCRKNEDL